MVGKPRRKQRNDNTCTSSKDHLPEHHGRFPDQLETLHFGSFHHIVVHPRDDASLRIKYLAHRKSSAFEIGLLQQAFVLMRHDIGLNLRHEVHSHYNNDQQGSAPEIERNVPFED